MTERSESRYSPTSSLMHTVHTPPFNAETHLKPLLRVLLQQGAVEVN